MPFLWEIQGIHGTKRNNAAAVQFLVQNKSAKLWYTLGVGTNSTLHNKQPPQVQLWAGSQQRKSLVPSRIWFWSSSQGWNQEQSVSLQDLFVGQWWSGRSRKENTFIHLFSQPRKLVGASFQNISYISFHLYPLDFVHNRWKIIDCRSHKIFFQSVSFMSLLERQR